MNSTLEYIANNTKKIKRLLGIDYENLQLIAIAELRHSQKQEELEKNKTRIIKNCSAGKLGFRNRQRMKFFITSR